MSRSLPKGIHSRLISVFPKVSRCFEALEQVMTETGVTSEKNEGGVIGSPKELPGNLPSIQGRTEFGGQGIDLTTRGTGTRGGWWCINGVIYGVKFND